MIPINTSPKSWRNALPPSDGSQSPVDLFSARAFSGTSELLVLRKAKKGKERGMMTRKFLMGSLGAWLLAMVALGVTGTYGRC